MKVLAPREAPIVAAMVTALLPTAESGSMVERIDHHLSSLSPLFQFIFRFLLWRFELGALVARGRRLTRLARRQRESYLESWRTHRFYLFRSAYRFFEVIIHLCFYSDPKVYTSLGFQPPPPRHHAEPPPFQDSSERDLFLKVDACIIGSGAGGAVVAKELAEAGHSVVILEEGGFFTINDFGKEPVEIVEQLYRGGGMQVAVGLPMIGLPTGRGVGGTTVINSGTCFRLPNRLLEQWNLPDLSPEIMKPYFEKVEQNLNVGPVPENLLGKNVEIFRRGLEKLGKQGKPLLRAVRDCEGAGVCCFGCPNDAKQSVHLSYIPQAIAKGARLFARCKAESIIPCQDYGIVKGRFQNGNEARSIEVQARVVVVAAGTLISPHLLKKSGVLNRHLGKHLSIHPASKVIALFDESIEGWKGVPQGYQYDGMHEEGILFEGVFTPPSFAAMNLVLPPSVHHKMMAGYRRFASFGFMITDEGRGSVHWLPHGEPIVFYNIKKSEVYKFVKAARFLTEVYLEAGAREVYSGIPTLGLITPATGLKPFDQNIKRTDLDLAAFHPLGTCRMGIDRSSSVVNSFGEVHGVKNLFVTDGSIFPSPLGVNPQETIMAFATRTAEFIHQRLNPLS